MSRCRAAIVGAALVLALAVTQAVTQAATPTVELQKTVRAATFEMVMRKPQNDPLTYDRPLPLELLPFKERNDLWWSIGTAFAIDTDTLVTAAHVFFAKVGSQSAELAVRDSAGNIHAIDRLLKFSGHEDFALFSIKDLEIARPLATRRGAEIDEAVFAVGNALGEGVVIRDGLLTSMTPEQEDGRWNWLRFSAATSPGNSGGPLLDASGRVLGVVVAKSPGENLNYALPIERVLAAPQRAVTDMRVLFRLPIFGNGDVSRLRLDFDLPLSVDAFESQTLAGFASYYRQNRDATLSRRAAELFPRAGSADALAKLQTAFCGGVLSQQDDRKWEVVADGSPARADLPGGGEACAGDFSEFTHFHVRSPRASPSPRETMEHVLKALPIPRQVATESVRVTSLGDPARTEQHTDAHGRHWRAHVWPVPHFDFHFIGLFLPTPDGSAGILSLAPRGGLFQVLEGLKLRADLFYITYRGTLAQWQSFLADPQRRPAALASLRLQRDAGGLKFRSPRFDFDVPDYLFKVSDDSPLSVYMTYALVDDALVWGVAGARVTQSRDQDVFVAAYRQPKPAAEAGSTLQKRWKDMQERSGDFVGTRGHDSDWSEFWMRTSASGDGPASTPINKNAAALYELISNSDAIEVPNRIDTMHAKFLETVRIREP